MDRGPGPEPSEEVGREPRAQWPAPEGRQVGEGTQSLRARDALRVMRLVARGGRWAGQPRYQSPGKGGGWFNS